MTETLPHHVKVSFEPHNFPGGGRTRQLTVSMPNHALFAQPLFESGISSVALIQKPAGYKRDPQSQGDRHGLMILIQGSLQVTSGDFETTLTPGMAAFCPVSLPMGRWCSEPVWFASINLYDAPSWAPLAKNGPYARTYEHTDLFVPTLAKLLAARDVETAEAQMEGLEYSKFLVDLLKRELRYVTKRKVTPVDLKLEKLVGRIRQHPELGWSLDAMAEELGTSRRTLGRLIKDEYGAAPLELVLKYRVEKAAKLLTHSNQKVDQIARVMGYASTSSFSEFFLRYTGVRPGRFRRNIGLQTGD